MIYLIGININILNIPFQTYYYFIEYISLTLHSYRIYSSYLDICKFNK